VLRAAGAEPIVVDVFDAAALSKKLAAARPDLVAHLLSDLPLGLPPDRMDEGTRRNARARRTPSPRRSGRACGA